MRHRIREWTLKKLLGKPVWQVRRTLNQIRGFTQYCEKALDLCRIRRGVDWATECAPRFLQLLYAILALDSARS